MARYQWTAVLVSALLITLVTSDDNEVAVVRGNNDFGLQWYQVQSSKNSGNVLLAPSSAAIVLAMLAMGAEGSTFSELAKGLHLEMDKDTIAKGFQSMLNSIRKAGEGNETLTTANRMYTDSTFDIKEPFKTSITEYFYSDIVPADFMGNPEVARGDINQWVEDETHDRIQNLLPEGVVDQNTRSVLVNAIYFKGFWSIKFNKRNTRSQQFYKSCNDVKQVDMMQATGSYKYADFPSYQAIQLDYQGGDLHMLILLPKGCDDGSRLEEVMRDVNLTDLKTSLQSTKVRLSLPKFKIEQTIEMKPDLEEMGMGEIFTDSANLSGISNEPLKVSAVIQKTFMEVSEEGTEAAAATAVIIGRRSSVVIREPNIREFKADHPFVCVIVEKTSQAVLFLGRYRGPQ